MTDIEATEASYHHWVRIYNLVPGEMPEAKQCALCDLYNSVYNNLYCRGCLIQKETRLTECCGTPYKKALSAWWRLINDDSKDRKADKALIWKEVEFIRNLLPADHLLRRDRVESL